MPLVTYNNCTVQLSDSFSLQNLTWSVTSGQVWAIVGANGSGKSALVASTLGTGTVLQGTRDLAYKHIAVVSLEEQAWLIQRELERDDSDLTDEISSGTLVYELLDEVCSDQELRRELIQSFDLEPLLNRGFRKLSTGETRKLLFARAIASKPDLLILDDPFEGLDVDARPKIEQLIEAISSDTSLILVLNRVDDIPDFTTHALRMEEGRISQHLVCDSVDEVRARLKQIIRIRSQSLDLPAAEAERLSLSNDDGSLVRMNDVRVAYTDNIVFEGLNWSLSPGMHWQVKGPNGSGKTCLLNLITGDHPQCYVNDISLFGMQRGQGESIWQIKQHIGFVSTALHWDYRLSISVKNVVLSGFYDSIGLYQAANERQQELVGDWLSLLGLSARANDSFASLSYGEQRVLLIVRAMVKHPPVLLLDEPCLGLDDSNRMLVLALIERICDEGITTLVYVTHHEEDRIAQIENVLTLG